MLFGIFRNPSLLHTHSRIFVKTSAFSGELAEKNKLSSISRQQSVHQLYYAILVRLFTPLRPVFISPLIAYEEAALFKRGVLVHYLVLSLTLTVQRPGWLPEVLDSSVFVLLAERCGAALTIS